jgi:hypothetical protein
MSAPLQAPLASLSAAASATDEEQRLGACDTAADRWMLDGSDARAIFDRLLPSPAEMAAACNGGACSRVGLAYNAAALAGWVPQPSPCCAAAAVAGAWNSLAGLRRSSGDGGSSGDSADSSANSASLAPPMLHDRVLAAYARQLSSALAQKHRSFERRLGAASSAAPLLRAIGAGLRAAGRDLTAKAGTHAHVTRRALEAVVRSAAVVYHQQKQQEQQSALQPQPDSQSLSVEDGDDKGVNVTSTSSMAASAITASTSRSALDCVIELLALDGVDVVQLDAAAEAEAVRQLLAAAKPSDSSGQATGGAGAGASVEESDDENDKVLFVEGNACLLRCFWQTQPLFLTCALNEHSFLVTGRWR